MKTDQKLLEIQKLLSEVVDEFDSLKQPAVRRSKIKVIHGTFVEEPKCKICNVDIPHEWLDGDYTLLMCLKKDCWDELNKRYERP